MTRSSVPGFTAAALIVAALGTSTIVSAYGTAAPMGVTHIEAQAPVTSVNATAALATPAEAPKPQTRTASRLRNWIAALRQRLDGAIEVALR
jgi:hypothetical protein